MELRIELGLSDSKYDVFITKNLLLALGMGMKYHSETFNRKDTEPVWEVNWRRRLTDEPVT